MASGVAQTIADNSKATTPTQTPHRSTVFLVLILGTLTATGPLATDMYLPAFPDIAKDLHAPQAQIQLTLTAAMVGLAVGQLIIGPLSDAWGRRKPMLIGTLIFTVTSFLCMFVPTAEMFIGLRFVQGLAGAAGAVVARAIVRDHFDGDAVAKFFSRLVLVTMLAPMLGPILGAQLLKFGSWQLGFAVLTVVAGVGLVVAYFLLPESLPAHRRQAVSFSVMIRNIRKLLSDSRFIGPALTLSLTFGMMFTYISTFSFVSQSQFGASAQQYSMIFAINTLGILSGTQVNGYLIGKVAVFRRLFIGLACASIAIIALASLTASGNANLIDVTIALFVMMFGAGHIFPNCTSLALGSQPPEIAGTGSALMGTMQFALGGFVPTAAAWTTSGLVSMGSMVTVMTIALLCALPIFTVSMRRAARYAT